MAEMSAKFIQIKSEAGLKYLQSAADLAGLNAYSLKTDKTGRPLICIGLDEDGAYQGHDVIVRCTTQELRDAAETVVREKLGMAPRPRAQEAQR